MLRVFLFLTTLMLIGGLPTVWAADRDSNPGYISDVSYERQNLALEVVILPPDEQDEKSLSEKIFTEKVTKEFQMRYEERFGQTRTEQFISIPSRFFETQVQPGQYRTLQEEVLEQRRFGNFMIKRLIEVHVDKYMKENPSARPVYELKEKLSNVDVQVRPGYKFKFKYSLSSNEFDVLMENPQKIYNKVSIRMGTNETLVFLGYPITKTINLVSNYNLDSEDVAVSGVKQLNQYWSTSLTGSNTEIEGDKIILGLGWRD